MAFYNSEIKIHVTDKQRMLVSILTDILNESRGEIIRRLLLTEAKRASAFIDGEELDLWLDLIGDIEREDEMHSLITGEAISEGRARRYEEKTGKKLEYIDKRTLDRHAEKNYASVKKWRAKRKLIELSKEGWFNEKKVQRKEKDGTKTVPEKDL